MDLELRPWEPADRDAVVEAARDADVCWRVSAGAGSPAPPVRGDV